ncbi:MAG: response regulator [Leptolyngbya sp. SIO1D8]|nr:response regulator [Leptolyngbya sp. SIO1D8]
MVINPQKMLLVENDPNDVELMQLALRDLSYIRTLDILNDGEQAISYLLGSETQPPVSQLPRFVLMDLQLPKLTGIEVLRAIRSHPSTQFLPVVMMTSSAEERDLGDCYNSGVNSYVVKPLDSQQFQELARLVGRYWMTMNTPLDILNSFENR